MPKRKPKVLSAPGTPTIHPHTKRALTQIRQHAAKASKQLKKAVTAFAHAVTALEVISITAGENDARELKKRPSLKRAGKGKGKKKARR